MDTDLRNQILAIERSHRRLRVVTIGLGTCLALMFLLGAVEGTVQNGNFAVSGLIRCTRLQTDESASFAGDLLVTKKLSVGGEIDSPTIQALRTEVDQLKADYEVKIAVLRKEVYADFARLVVNDPHVPKEFYGHPSQVSDYAVNKMGFRAGVPNGHIGGPAPGYSGAIYFMPKALQEKAEYISK
jgi:hypothetical protein